jgi:BMFP domain-containing protein YqiC
LVATSDEPTTPESAPISKFTGPDDTVMVFTESESTPSWRARRQESSTNPGDKGAAVVDNHGVNQPPRRTYSRLAAVWIMWWSLWSVVFVIATISEASGDNPDDDSILVGILLTILTGSLAAARVVMNRAANRRPVEAAKPMRALAAAAPRLPGKKSAAREPMQRLAGAETALRDLLRQLGDAPVSREVVDAARRTATETADRLRALAAKVEAVEAAVAYSPAGQRAGLEDGTRSLLAHLERGLDGYQELVAAAGHLVLADSTNPVPDGLVEATDHLAGLAAALRELSHGQ